MKFIITILFTLIFKCVENRMLTVNCVTVPTYVEDTDNVEGTDDRVFNLSIDESEEYDQNKKEPKQKSDKPCSVVVLSNIQNPNMQSLLRKYRYDARGVLIPSSVKYFVKLPQPFRSSPILVPLNDKAFSPQGGFVRYYKEVPPIPHLW